MIEQDTIKLLRECDAGIRMGVDSIDDVLDHVRSRDFHSHLTRCREEHETLSHDMAAFHFPLVELHILIHGNLLTAIRRSVTGTSEKYGIRYSFRRFPVSEMIAPGVEHDLFSERPDRIDHNPVDSCVL